MSSPQPAEIPFFFTHVFSWLLVVFGVSLSKKSLLAWLRAVKSKRWPTAEGRVVSCSIDFHSTSEDGPDIRYARIEYRYVVGGEEHTGARISFADLSHTGANAEAYVTKHPKGSRVLVYHDPLRPADALLEPGVRVQVIFGLCFSLIVLGGGAILVFVFRAWRVWV
jgi:hypothetical protein